MSLITQGAEQFTGTATYVKELLAEFAMRPGALRVEVLCNEHAARHLESSVSDVVRLTRTAGPRIGSTRAGRAVALVGARANSRRLARRFSPDVGLIHYPLTLGVPSVRLPTILSLHDVQHHDLPEHFSRAERLWRRLFYDGPASRATLVHTLSEYSKSRIVARLGVHPDRVVVIPLAVDHQRFRPAASAHESEMLLPLRLPARFLFYPATLWPHKNHLQLLAALAAVDDDALHLVLCGGAYGRLSHVLDAAARLGVGDRVRHLGFVSDRALPAVYRRATALVFPSTYEGFGAPPLEAMASGCPVASSRAGPLAEVCGEAALELVPDDAGQMAGAITRLVADEALRSQLRQAGLQRAAAFSWAAVADAHLLAYARASALHRELGSTRTGNRPGNVA